MNCSAPGPVMSYAYGAFFLPAQSWTSDQLWQDPFKAEAFSVSQTTTPLQLSRAESAARRQAIIEEVAARRQEVSQWLAEQEAAWMDGIEPQDTINADAVAALSTDACR
eukprot:tig00000241_g21054.t1